MFEREKIFLLSYETCYSFNKLSIFQNNIKANTESAGYRNPETFHAADAVKESNGLGIKVCDDEILSAQKEIAHKTGLLVEPSCASTFAAYQKVKDKIEKDEKVMLLMTGSGLKDFDSLKMWNEKSVAKSSDKWKEILIKDN